MIAPGKRNHHEAGPIDTPARAATVRIVGAGPIGPEPGRASDPHDRRGHRRSGQPLVCGSAAGAASGAARSGLRPLPADGHTEPDAVDAMADQRVDDIVLVGTPSLSAVTQANKIAGSVPVVGAGTRKPLLSGVDLVANDDHAGARAAAHHLLELGHRRVASIVGEGEAGETRRAGFETVMERAGLEVRTVVGDWTEATGHRQALGLLRGPERPTAIFAANDLSAVGVLTAADELGLSVPGRLYGGTL